MKDRRTLKILLALVSITLAVYIRSAWFPFNEIDDRDYAVDNLQVMAGLTLDSVQWAFTTFHASNWHPLTWLSLMLDSQLFGIGPMGYHATNAVLHTLNTALVFLLFRSLTGTLWRSAFVAACFALHPLHVESVAWISERKDVLSGMFWMLTLICYSSYVREGRRSRYLLSLAFFALGLMAKPMLVTIPVILLLLDLWPLERTGLLARGKEEPFASSLRANLPQLKRLILEKVPFILLAGASSAMTVYAQSKGGAVISLVNLPLSGRVSNAVWAVLNYLVKTFYPADLAIYYPYQQVPYWKAGCALVALVAISYLCLSQLRNYPWLSIGWLWFLVTLLPVIGLVQVGSQSMADRYTYLPHLGIFVIVSWGGGELWSRLSEKRRIVELLAVAGLLCMAALTCLQLNYWADNVRLLNHTIDVTENNFFATNALGLAYERIGENAKALEEFKRTEEAFPQNPDMHLLRLHMGNVMNGLGRHAEALVYFEEILRKRPTFWQAHYNRGKSLESLNRPQEALEAYRETLKLKPDNAAAHNNIGRLLARHGQVDEAIGHFSKAVELDPRLDQARKNLATALKQKRDEGAH